MELFSRADIFLPSLHVKSQTLLERMEGFCYRRATWSSSHEALHHKQFRHLDGRVTTVPFHPGRDISPSLLRQIAHDIGLPLEEFLAVE